MKYLGAQSSITQQSTQQNVVAVPKNVQRKWSYNEREPGRSKFATPQYLHSQSPVAKITGNSSAYKTSNAYNATSGAVKKEKMRNPAALAYEHNHNLHSTSSSASRLSSDHAIDLNNESHDPGSILNPKSRNEAIDHDNSPVRSEGSEQVSHVNRLESNTYNDAAYVKNTDFAIAAPIQQIQHSQDLHNNINRSDHQQSISSNSNPRTSVAFESLQCDMAEADQASICSSPEKPSTSNNNNDDTFHEIILTLPHGNSINSSSNECLNGAKLDNDGDRMTDNDNVAMSESGRHSFSDEITLDHADSGIQAIHSSLMNEDLERRQLEEESQSALTVNAIVEEILNSPTSSIDALVTGSNDQK